MFTLITYLKYDYVTPERFLVMHKFISIKLLHKITASPLYDWRYLMTHASVYTFSMAVRRCS